MTCWSRRIPPVLRRRERTPGRGSWPPSTRSKITSGRSSGRTRPGRRGAAARARSRLLAVSVYDHSAYVGLLTTNTIARWLAAQLSSSGGLAEAESVGQVLAFAEPHEGARHGPRTITAADAVFQLSSEGRTGRTVTALIITERGQPAEKPLALVVDDDLPALLKALEIS